MNLKEDILSKSGLLIEDRYWDDVNKVIDRYLKRKNITDEQAKKDLTIMAKTIEIKKKRFFNRADKYKYLTPFLSKYTKDTLQDETELEELVSKIYDYLGV
jgi:DNA polymerase I-like protein with 3'-5' exonuclease and polymerase domains